MPCSTVIPLAQMTVLGSIMKHQADPAAMCSTATARARALVMIMAGKVLKEIWKRVSDKVLQASISTRPFLWSSFAPSNSRVLMTIVSAWWHQPTLEDNRGQWEHLPGSPSSTCKAHSRPLCRGPG